jgi:hypothetical protein
MTPMTPFLYLFACGYGKWNNTRQLNKHDKKPEPPQGASTAIAEELRKSKISGQCPVRKHRASPSVSLLMERVTPSASRRRFAFCLKEREASHAGSSTARFECRSHETYFATNLDFTNLYRVEG